MGCRDIHETISACVDGEASPGEAAAVREHLASCERCRVLERQMRAVGAGVRQVRGSVPDRFREKVFARLESEGALPKRKKVFPAAWRWAAVPLAAAAGLGLFLLTSRETVRGPVPPGPGTARVETSARTLRPLKWIRRHSPPRTGRCSHCSTFSKTRPLSTRTTTRRGWSCSPRETPRIRRTLPGAEGARHGPGSIPFHENGRGIVFPARVRDPPVVARNRYCAGERRGGERSRVPQEREPWGRSRRILRVWTTCRRSGSNGGGRCPPRSASGSGSGTGGGRSFPRKSASGSWSGSVDGGSSPRSSGAT